MGIGLAVSATALAQSAPHWAGQLSQIDCTTQCHIVHHASGGTLSAYATNANLCQSCHNPSGVAADFPVSNADKAVLGQTGTSHAFEATAVNDAAGAALPVDLPMQQRVIAGKIVCSTCHNQHSASSTMGGTPRVGAASKLTALGSPDGLTAGGTFSGADGQWYLVEIAVGGTQSGARFGFSKDGGTSWFPSNCSPGNAAPGAPWQYTTGCLTAAGATPVTLDSGVTVAFTVAGTYMPRERWEVSATWPFLRAQLDSTTDDSIMCRDCHRAWNMTHSGVETWNGSYKSHPVGVALNANGKGYDRSAPLDGNGGNQSPGDGNPSNDLTLDGSSRVHCLTCHGVHHADSNTKTADGPP